MDCNSPALARRNVRVSVEYLERDALFSQALGEGEPAEPGADDENMRFPAIDDHSDMPDRCLP